MVRRSVRNSVTASPSMSTRSRTSAQSTTENETSSRNATKQRQQGEKRNSVQKREVEEIPPPQLAEQSGQENQEQSKNVQEVQPQPEETQEPIVIDVKEENGANDSKVEANVNSTKTEPVDEEMKNVSQQEVVPSVVIADVQTQGTVQAVTNSSATNKALSELQKVWDQKKGLRKKQKIPSALRRQRMNQRLNKILAPKSGLIFLHEMKPGCTYKFHEQQGSNPPIFVAQVEWNGQVLASGQGMSKLSAKVAAAENAIKAIVAESFAHKFSANQHGENHQVKNPSAMEQGSSADDLMDTSDQFSWAGLASFAMYKMFSEWQNQGGIPIMPSVQTKKKPIVTKPPPVRTELPPNADKLHPSLLLNIMRPGVVSVELNRLTKDNMSSVTVGFEIDGKMYTGSGNNKKEGRKEAAKAVLKALYGLKYTN